MSEVQNEVQRLTTSQIVADLQAGLTRKEIGEKYNLNGIQVKAVFKNPSLKHRKTVKVKGAGFILVDDIAAPGNVEVAHPSPTVAENIAAEVVNPPIGTGHISPSPSASPEQVTEDKALWES